MGAVEFHGKIPPKPKTDDNEWVLCRRSRRFAACFMPEHGLILQPGDYCWLPDHEAGQRMDFDVVEFGEQWAESELHAPVDRRSNGKVTITLVPHGDHGHGGNLYDTAPEPESEPTIPLDTAPDPDPLNPEPNHEPVEPEQE